MIEQEVRDMLRAKVRHAPGLDEPPPAVLRRARGRRVLNAAGLGAGLAVIAVGSLIGVRSLGTSKIEPVTKVVRWVELEAFKGHPAPTRTCGPQDFTFKAFLVEGGIVEGPKIDIEPSFVFTPRNWRTNCKFILGSSTAALRIVDDEGRDMRVRVRDELPVEIWGSAATNFPFQWSNYCGPSTRAATFEISFATGEKLTTSAEVRLPKCIDRSKASTVRASTFDPPPGSLGQILPGSIALPEEFGITLTVPKTVRAGSVLRYQVVFTNTTDHDVSLEPCPDFVQYLFSKTEGNPAPTHANGSAGHLNCIGVGPIRPGKSVAFEMRIQTGADLENHLPIGLWQIRWLFATGSDPISAPVLLVS